MNYCRYEFNTIIAQTLNNWGATGRENLTIFAGYGRSGQPRNTTKTKNYALIVKKMRNY
jgi:hypothetical protein